MTSNDTAKPDMIRFTEALRQRRWLRDIAAGTDTGQDVTTLEDFAVVAKLRESEEG